VLDPVNTSIVAHIYSDKDYDFGSGTCGAMLDLNDSTNNSEESVIVACTYSKFLTSLNEKGKLLH
jgi:hypothetical protein